MAKHKIRDFIIIGIFVFLATYFLNGELATMETGRFFTLPYEREVRLPFCIAEALIAGCLYTIFNNRKT